jgi:hypothetical protein
MGTKDAKVGTDETEAHTALLICVATMLKVGTAEREAYSALLIWVSMTLKSGQLKKEHIVQCRYGCQRC